jgi:uncharacterized cupredoxin-like copper-binding protein
VGSSPIVSTIGEASAGVVVPCSLATPTLAHDAGAGTMDRGPMMLTTRRRIGARSRCAVLSVALAVLTTASLGVNPSSASAAKPKTVNVKLREFKVRPKPKSVGSGPTKFKVKNVGGLVHELVVVRTDGVPLPLAADGSIDEDKIPASATIGEVEDVSPKKTGTLEVKDLEPGTYTLFCNVVEQSGTTSLAHYAEGMHTTFTVRGSRGGAAARTISGRISYAGKALAGHKIVIAVNRQGESAPAYSATLTKLGEYSISGVTDGSYSVVAFIDVGDDMGPPKADEPAGTYDPDGNGTPDLVVMVNGGGGQGIDIVLKDR